MVISNWPRFEVLLLGSGDPVFVRSTPASTSSSRPRSINEILFFKIFSCDERNAHIIGESTAP